MIKKITLCMVALILLVSCSKNTKEPSEVVSFMSFEGISENGIYHKIKTDEFDMVYFYDFKNKEDIPLCSKVNCNHKNKDCDAYKLTFYKKENLSLGLPPVAYNENLYFFYEDIEKGIVTLCKSDPDGENRKEVIEFKKNSMMLSAMFYDNKLWYSMNEFQIDDKGNSKGYETNYSSDVLDLKDNKITSLDDTKTTQIHFRGVANKKVYVYKTDFAYPDDVSTIAAYDLETEKFEEVTKDGSSKNSFLVNTTYYDYDISKNEVYEWNTKTQERKRILNVKIPDGYKAENFTNDPSGIMTLYLSKDNKRAGTIYIDVETKEIIESEKPILTKANDKYYVLNDNQTISELP